MGITLYYMVMKKYPWEEKSVFNLMSVIEKVISSDSLFTPTSKISD